MNRILPVLLIAALVTAGCSSRKEHASGQDVALLQFADHPALDSIRDVFLAELRTRRPDTRVSTYSAHAEMTTATQMALAIRQKRPDLVVAIATPAAQACAAQMRNIPILFVAVSDPVGAGLLASPQSPEGNVTGVSDAPPLEPMLRLIRRLQPGCEKLGVLLNPSEANSQSTVNRLRPICLDAEIQLTERAVNTPTDVDLAARELVKRVDAIFMILDNTVASAFPALLQACRSAGKSLYCADATYVEHGADASCSVNYAELARDAAEMADLILGGTAIRELPIREPRAPVEVLAPGFGRK